MAKTLIIVPTAFIISAGAVMLALSVQTSHATEVIKPPLAEIVSESDHILVADLIESDCASGHTNVRIDIATFDVQAVLKKGPAYSTARWFSSDERTRGEFISVIFDGSLHEGNPIAPDYEIGHRYILFLKDSPFEWGLYATYFRASSTAPETEWTYELEQNVAKVIEDDG